MRKFIFLSFILISSSHFLWSQNLDSTAYKFVHSQLNVIKKFVEDKYSDSTVKRSRVITFMTDLTGIPSESDGNYIGQLNPTQSDYLRWSLWLDFNKEYLSWDTKSRKIVLRKELNVKDYFNSEEVDGF